MQKVKEQLVLCKEDYDILISCLRSAQGTFDQQNIEELQAEIKKAKLVSSDNFPQDVVRLNSKVRVKEEANGKVMELMLVTPDKADIKERKISIMAPIGTALIGFRSGQKVNWQVPAGKKTFTIMEVINHYE